MARLEKEAEERERQRRIDEHNEIKKRAARERLDQLKSTELGAKAFADLKEEVRLFSNCIISFYVVIDDTDSSKHK